MIECRILIMSLSNDGFQNMSRTNYGPILERLERLEREDRMYLLDPKRRRNMSMSNSNLGGSIEESHRHLGFRHLLAVENVDDGQ